MHEWAARLQGWYVVRGLALVLVVAVLVMLRSDHGNDNVSGRASGRSRGS